MKHKLFEWVRCFLRWLFGAPFQELPSEFGDPVPAELRVFGAEVTEIQHHPQSQMPLSPPVSRERI
jgi:hypothetical protein